MSGRERVPGRRARVEALLAGGTSYADAGRLEGVSYQRVQQIARDAGVQCDPAWRLHNLAKGHAARSQRFCECQREAQGMRDQGMLVKQIAWALGSA